MKSTNSKTPLIVGALAVASIIGAAGFVLSQRQSDTDSATPTTTRAVSQSSATESDTSPSGSTATTESTAAAYQDGTYAAAANYAVPRGENNRLEVSVTLTSGIISDITAEGKYTDDESKEYIDAFEAAVEDSVVGKALDAISLSRIGGASLTTQAFSDVLVDIRNQAKA